MKDDALLLLIQIEKQQVVAAANGCGRSIMAGSRW